MKVQGNERTMACNPATTRRHADSRSHGVKYATGSTEVTHQAQCAQDVTGANDNVHNLKTRPQIRKKVRIGTWNVRGMLQPGKVEIIGREQKCHNVEILGITETHMRGSGFYTTPTGHTLYFSGPENESRNGVGICLSQFVNKSVLGYNPVSDRIMTMRLNTKPCRVNLVVVYAPTSQSSEVDSEDFYKLLEDTLKTLPRRDITVLMGDLNAKVGSTLHDDHLREVVGKYGLGDRNERGELWLQFCAENSLTIMNTCFENHPRRLYTWVMPGDRFRNQIDYITVSKRWRSCISNTKTYPGADCGSDHKLLVAELSVKLKRCPRNSVKRQVRPTDRQLAVFEECFLNNSENFKVDENLDVDTNWTSFKELLLKSRKELQNQNQVTDIMRKTWITNETWQVIKERKDLVAARGDSERTQYKVLSAMVQRLCRRDYNQYLNSICQDIEDHAQTLHTRDLFLKVKSITREFKPKTWAIEDSHGKLLTEIDHVAERWRLYCENLYKDPKKNTGASFYSEEQHKEPEIIESEVRNALKRLKANKSAGTDTIFAEELKHLGDAGIKILLDLCNQIWKTGKWPKDWKESLLIPLHKKGSTKSCENYRTVALISHASKIMLYVINGRLQSYLNRQIPSEQAGFVKGRGTREQIVNMRQLIEKSREFNVPMFMCFIDYSKAFDCVRWEPLWTILQEMGVPPHLVQLIASLYDDGESMVRLNDVVSAPFKPEKGVRQGCILSPPLFNIYGEYIMRRALEGWEGGIAVGGNKISNLRYADDTTLFASSEHELAELFSRVERESEMVGLSVNKSKTKVMIIDRAGQSARTGELADLECVKEFVYLGSMISDQGGCEKEIRRRTQMGKAAMSKMTKIWRNRNISNATKMRLVKTLVFSIFLYGSESWSIRAVDRKKIEAFEMWCWRRMLRIPWTAKRTNKSILEQLKIKTRLSTICYQRVLTYFGHIARRQPDNFEKLVVVGKVDGKRPRGRSPTRWSDQIKSITGLPVSTALKKAEDRAAWKQLVTDSVKAFLDGHDLQ